MNLTPRIVCCLLLSAVCWSPSCAQSSDLQAIIAKLHAIRISDEVETEVPPEARSLLKELKHGLRDLATEVINSTNGSVISPEQLTSAVVERLKNMRIAPEPRRTVVYSGPDSFTEDTWHPYGQINDIRIEQTSSHPELLSLITTLNIGCGTDSSLYVFERKQKAWVLKIQREENDYAEISGAMEALEHRISPSDERGNWFVLIASTHPWCTSCWNGVHYQVLRPSGQSNKPNVAYEARKEIYRCNDELYSLSAKAHEFSISYQGSMSHDPDLWGRVYIEHFQIKGDSVVRIDPLAKYPVDFIDEWLDLPEGEAMRWVNSKARSQATVWHRKLEKPNKNWEAFDTEYALQQRCPTKIPSWHVGLSIGATGRKKSELSSTEVFFTVVDQGIGFRIDGISKERPSGCPGGDRPSTETNSHDLALPD